MSIMLERIHKLIQHDTIPPQSVIDLLAETLIGTAGTRYQLLDTETKIYALNKPHFFYLERNKKAVGSFTVCERDVSLNGQNENGLYIRYFAFDTLFQGGTDKGKGQSNFHIYFKALFNTSNLNPINPKKEKSVYWAYIDPQNLRSYNMNERFGFQTIGKFKTTAFSRGNPKRHTVERLAQNDQKDVSEKIKQFYHGFQFFSDTHLFEGGNYFVRRVDGKIVCGIQANPVHWRIKSLPGLSGKILLQFAPYLPGIKKVINPKNHRFLATEGLFWEKGHEMEVSKLLEGILAETKHNSLLIWTDEKNSYLDLLKLKWGFIQQTKKDNHIHIVAHFNNYTRAEITEIKASPKYLSGFDVT